MTAVLGSAIAGEDLTLDGKVFVIAEKCSSLKSGQWMCINHDQKFQHNLEKDSHIDEGVHVLVWICFEHGPEVP